MPRKKKTEDSVILKMILRVIIKQGATTFSLEDLSKETGLSPATLLQRFGSKKEILHKAIELANHDLQNDLTNRPVGNKSPLQEVMDIYMEFSAPFLNPSDVASGLDILKLDITEERLNHLTRNYFEIRRNKIESLIILARVNGEISADINADELAWNLECLWQGSIMMWALTGEGLLHDWMKERFSTYLNHL